MDIALHQIVDRRVNQSMPRHRRDAAKRLRHDANSKVALACGRAGMALVQMAFIFHRQLRRRKALLQPLAQTPRAGHSRSRGRGFAGKPEYLWKHEEHGRDGKSKDLELDPKIDSKVFRDV